MLNVLSLFQGKLEKFVTMTFSLYNRGGEHSAMSATIFDKIVVWIQWNNLKFK